MSSPLGNRSCPFPARMARRSNKRGARPRSAMRRHRLRPTRRQSAPGAAARLRAPTPRATINPPTDRVLNLETEQRQIAQYSRNASRALGLSQASYSGLQAIKKVSDRATQIGTLGASINSASAAGAYATEVDQLIEQTLQSANGRFGNSEFVWGNPRLQRSTERPLYQAWKACQKG
eukprot:gene31815-42438_t